MTAVMQSSLGCCGDMYMLILRMTAPDRVRPSLALLCIVSRQTKHVHDEPCNEPKRMTAHQAQSAKPGNVLQHEIQRSQMILTKEG